MTAVGRPTKLTSEVQARIVQAIAAGSYLEQAAAYGGVDYATFRRWVLKGAQPHAPRNYREFCEAVKRAENEAEVLALAQWRTAFKDDWRAIATFLERRYPDRWGRKDRIELEHLLRREAEKLADETGVSADDLLAEAEAILRSR